MSRVLILGTAKAPCTDLCHFVIRQLVEQVPWTVITSFESNKDRWQSFGEASLVKEVLTVKEVGERTFDPTEPVILDHVSSLGFLSKPWVKTLAVHGSQMVLVTPHPFQLLNKEEMDTFNYVMVAAKTSRIKASLFGNIFLGGQAEAQSTFLRDVNALEKEQYLLRALEGFVVGHMFREPTNQPAPQHAKPRPAMTQPAAQNKVAQNKVAEIKAPEMKEPDHMKTFKTEQKIPAEHVKVWANIELRGATSTDPIEEVKGALSNPLIMSMIFNSFIERFGGDADSGRPGKILLCFYVHSQNLDLFQMLLLRVLRSLRTNKLIRRGGVFF